MGEPQDDGIGERLRLLRNRAMLSQAELAVASSISRNTINRIEGGRAAPQPATVRMLAAALRLDGPAGHWLLTGEGTPGPAPASAMPQPMPLPVPLPQSPLATPFVGRRAEIEAIAAALADPGVRLLTLAGPGGIGKTRLALEAVRAHAGGRLPAGAVVTLANLADPEDVLPAIAAALGVPAPGGDLRGNLTRALAGQTRLLTLDNLDHLLQAAPDLEWLLANAPGLRLLVTSRESLHVPGERVMVVQPLPVDGVESPAVELFIRLGRQSSPALGDDPETLADIRELCGRLGGFPLAIELAAVQLDVLTPATLLALLSGAGLRALAPALPSATRRHLSMEETIAWSADRLAPGDQRLLEVLSVFPTAFRIDAAERVFAAACPVLPIGPGETAAAIARLARAHLIQSSQGLRGGGPARFTMLPPIRLFALGRLREAGLEPAARRAHAEYAAFLFDMLDRQIRLNRTNEMDRIEEEYPNGRAALDWALDAGDADIAGRLVSSLKYAHMFRYRSDVISAQMERLTGSSGVLTPRSRFWILYERAELASREGDLPRLRAVIDKTLAGGPGDDPRAAAMMLLFQSSDLDQDAETALATIDRAGALLGDDLDMDDPPFLQAWLLVRRGVELHRLGRLAEARTALEAGVARKAREGNAIGEGAPLAHLGRVLQDLGLPRQAATTLLSALDLAANNGDDWLRFHAARWLADLARSGGPDAADLAADLTAALAADYALHRYGLSEDDPGPLPDPASGPALSLPDAIARSQDLPALLPASVPPVPGARLRGMRLE
ncbi:MAG: ATP-binding protein [Thermomicrobiales bacterium]